jgi:hypothetical protein
LTGSPKEACRIVSYVSASLFATAWRTKVGDGGEEVMRGTCAWPRVVRLDRLCEFAIALICNDAFRAERSLPACPSFTTQRVQMRARV